jgi:hypothetical protein
MATSLLADVGLGLTMVVVLAGFIVLIAIIVIGKYFNLWIQSYLANARIGFFDILGMSVRKVNPTVIVRAQIMAVKAGLALDTAALEVHFLAGGNVPELVRALIAAKRAGAPLDFDGAAAADLAGVRSGAGAVESLRALAGKEGRTLGRVDPSGVALIDGRRCEVVAQGLPINADRPILVMSVEGSRVVVREIE